MKNIIKYWLPVLAWLGVIFYFSSRTDLPSGRIDWVDFIVKKSAHVCEFIILTLLSFRAFRRPIPDFACLLALSIAFSDEIHQVFTPGRGASLRDICIDSIGIAIASLWLVKYYSRWKKNTSHILLKRPRHSREK